MKKLTIAFTVLIALAFTTKNYKQEIACTTKDTINMETKDTPSSDFVPYYDIQFKIEKLNSKTFNLNINIALDSGAYFVSPLSGGDYKGIFNISIPENEHLTLADGLSEIPKSVESIDPWTGGKVNLVNETTTYSKTFNINSTSNFELMGKVKFVIEPRCTLEEITFSIVYRDGNIAIRKVDHC